MPAVLIMKRGSGCLPKSAASADRISAVDEDRGAGDEIGRTRSEEYCRSRAFLRRAEASGRRALDDVIVKWPSLYRCGHVALDPSGHDRVDLDIVRRQLDRRRLGQLHEPALGGGIRGRNGISEQRVLARNIDYLAAPALRHRARGDLREQEA